jgi:predicted nucleic acid-binding Zn ribbon protein
MPRCTNCWHEAQWADNFCPHCGKKIPERTSLRSSLTGRFTRGLYRFTRFIQRSPGIHTIIHAIRVENEAREKGYQRTIMMFYVLVSMLLLIVLGILIAELRMHSILPHLLGT